MNAIFPSSCYAFLAPTTKPNAPNNIHGYFCTTKNNPQCKKGCKLHCVKIFTIFRIHFLLVFHHQHSHVKRKEKGAKKEGVKHTFLNSDIMCTFFVCFMLVLFALHNVGAAFLLHLYYIACISDVCYIFLLHTLNAIPYIIV